MKAEMGQRQKMNYIMYQHKIYAVFVSILNNEMNAFFNLPKGTIFDVGTPDDRRRRFAAPRRSTNAEVKSLDAMVAVRSRERLCLSLRDD
jgi:hypothetical protein